MITNDRLHPRLLHMYRRYAPLFVLMSATVLFTGCAISPIPASPQTRPLSITAVQHNPAAFIGQSVRWGGRIVRVTPHRSRSEIEILAYPLANDGEPQTWQSEQGRFIAESAQFIDPAAYQPDELLTVVGVITTTQTRTIGDYSYTYPVVTIRNQYLWPSAETAAVLLPYDRPRPPHVYYWYDPPPRRFYSPPWRHHYPHHHRPPRHGSHWSIGVSGAW